MNCKVCNGKTDLFDENIILKKYKVKYYRCTHCGFVYTEEPFWLDEAYSAAITDADIGLAGRNFSLARRVSAIIKFCLKDTKNYLDYGGGYGLFVRLMRDNGFDFEWYDKYCQNIFAKGFEKSKSQYDVVTAFELLEHLIDPSVELQPIFALGNTIICTTELIPTPIPKVDEWWYFTPNTGQHICFYTEETMNILAKNFKKFYLRIGNIHIFTSEKIPMCKIKFCSWLPNVINRLYRYDSLLACDYKKITGHNLS